MPILIQKRQFCKNYTMLRPKKNNRIPFLLFFTKKSVLSCPYFVKKVISLKITHISCPYFVKKTSLLSKTLCSYVVFVKFFVKNTLLASHIWPKKVDSITSYYGPKKSIGCPFFPISHEKISAVMPIFCQQNVHSLKTHCSYVHILSKKNQFFK